MQLTKEMIHDKGDFITAFVKKRRKQKGLSQGQLAELSGVCRRTIQNAEVNILSMKVDNFISLLDALDIFILDLFN